VRVSIRNVRRDGMETIKKMEKDGDISEDDQKRLGEEIQKLTDEHVTKVDTMLADKEKDIMTV
jgi:ribosome recycling factor